MCRLVRRVAGFVCVAVWSCLGGSAAWATFIDSNDLFLAPASVPVRIYNPIDIDPGNSVTFSSSEVPGATALVGMHILPVLNPNPASTNGSYTRAQLGGINSGNYTGYYAFQPNADYFATTISGNASTATFDKDGFYFVELQTIKGKHLSNHVFLVAADDALAEDPAAGAKDKVGPQRKITLPAVDLTIISDGDPNDDHGGKGAMANAMKLFPTAMKAKTIADVIKDIKDYYDSHGKKKFEVLIIGHGRPGSIKIGTQRINNDADSTMTPAAFQAAVDQYVSSIHFGSCSTAAGAKGAAFLKAIADSGPLVSAYNGAITYTPTYADANANAKQIVASDVPEPTAMATIPVGLIALLWASRRRRFPAPMMT